LEGLLDYHPLARRPLLEEHQQEDQQDLQEMVERRLELSLPVEAAK